MAVSSVGRTPSKGVAELNKKIKSLQSGKLVDLMIVEPKTKVINVEYQSEVKEDSITKIKKLCFIFYIYFIINLFC